jgi:hypothetical protein
VGGTSLINTASIRTTGYQTYTGTVTLGANVIFTANTGSLVRFGSTVGHDGTARSLTAATANARFDGAIGGASAATALSSVEVGGTSLINTTSIRTTGNQTYTGAATLGVDGTTFLAGANLVRFIAGVDGDASTRTLKVGDGSNATQARFGGATGAANLTSIEVYGASTVDASATVNTTDAAGFQLYRGITNNNGTIYAGPVAAGNTAITFRGNYTAVSTGSLINNATGPDIQFGGDVTLGPLNQTTGTIIFYTGTSASHNLSLSATPVLGNVLISTGNTVTVQPSTTINQDNGMTLTLEGTGSTLTVSASNASWIMGNTTPGTLPVDFTSGFAGYDGTLVFNADSVLNTLDFYNDSVTNHNVNISGVNTQINASGDVEINRTFVPTGTFLLTHSTINMTGTGNIRVLNSASIPQAYIGSFIAAGTGTVTIASNIRFNGNVTINGTLNAGSSYIHMAGNGTSGSTWTIGGTFNHGTSTVEFGERSNTPLGPPGLGRTFTIAGTGRSNWYNFYCYEPMADLQFSNYAGALSGHRVNHRIEIEPRTPLDSPNIVNGYLILLTRANDIQLTPPGSPDYIPPDTPNAHFWYFDLASGAELYMHFVYIQYSFSKNRIPLPLSSSTIIVATPYVYMTGSGIVGTYNLGDPRSDSNMANPSLPPQPVTLEGSYYNKNWLVTDRFLYSFTEDSDGNGRIDRIRAQAAFDVTSGNTENAFRNFRVVVEGYEVTGYARADEDTTTPTASGAEDRMKDIIYIYLREKDYSDTGAHPVWWVEQNTTLLDATTKSIAITRPYRERLTVNDNAPPRINYALTVPGTVYSRPGIFSGTGLGEIYVQFSEPVDIGTLSVTNLEPGFSGVTLNSANIKPLNASGTEFLIPLNLPYQTSDLAVTAPPQFTLAVIQDREPYADDIRSGLALYAYQYPSPKYPIDWTFSDYIEVQGDPLNGKPFDTVPPGGTVPETVPRRDAGPGINNDKGNTDAPRSPDPIFPFRTHRVTDVLISVPPKEVTDTRYFVWPLWAKYQHADDYSGLGDTSMPGYGYMMDSDRPFNDADVIWDFTGRRFLERDDIVLQARVGDPSFILSSNSVVFDFSVAPVYRRAYGETNLWLPYSGIPSGNGAFFINLVPQFKPGYQSNTAASSGPRLFNFTFLQNALAPKSDLDFFFHLNNTPQNLFVGRLDITPGDPVPNDWYNRVKPFTFGVHDITRQRGGVTILNNVINSNNRENVLLDYKLDKSGRVTVQVFTLDGNLVKVLVRENQSAKEGYYRVAWDGTNNGGRPVARGMYFIRIVAPDIDEIRKVMVVK